MNDHWLDCCESNIASLYFARSNKKEGEKKCLSLDSCTLALDKKEEDTSYGAKSKRYPGANARGTKRKRPVDPRQSRNRQPHTLRNTIHSSLKKEETIIKSYYKLSSGKPRSQLGSNFIRRDITCVRSSSEPYSHSPLFHMNKEFTQDLRGIGINLKAMGFGEYGNNNNANANGVAIGSEDHLCHTKCYQPACFESKFKGAANEKQTPLSPQKVLKHHPLQQQQQQASGVGNNSENSLRPHLRFNNLAKILQEAKNGSQCTQACIYNQNAQQLSPMISRSQESDQSDGSLEYMGNCNTWMQQQQATNAAPVYSVAAPPHSVSQPQHLTTPLVGSHMSHSHSHSHDAYQNGFNHHTPTGVVECGNFFSESSDPFTDIMSEFDFLTADPYGNGHSNLGETTAVDFPGLEGELNKGSGKSLSALAAQCSVLGVAGNHPLCNNTSKDKCSSCGDCDDCEPNSNANHDSSNKNQQLKALEWLFIGKSCTCQKHSKEKVRGKSVKDLPCCKCLMEVFMTVHDAKKASKHCGMSPTTFKKRLRKIGIKTYPSRKIRCLFRCIQAKCSALTSIKDAEERVRIHDDLAKCREELRNFKDKLECVLNNGKAPPRLDLDFSGRFTKIRNRIHKTNYKKKRSSLSE